MERGWAQALRRESGHAGRKLVVPAPACGSRHRRLRREKALGAGCAAAGSRRMWWHTPRSQIGSSVRSQPPMSPARKSEAQGVGAGGG
jgi:hypothetical protein